MKRKLILFEDGTRYSQELLSALKKLLKRDDEVVLFPIEGAAKGGLYEELLAQELSQPQYAQATLIVADRDLSSIDRYRGLSEETVRRVAEKLGIPECGYARGEKADEFMRNAERREANIALSIKDAESFSRQAISVNDGFAAISEGISVALSLTGRKSAGRILASILGKPEYADKISLYAAGDASRLASSLGSRNSSEQHRNQLVCFLGYWLWDSVLRYPGVVVNETAASSFLNIRQEDFRRNEVRQLFDSAQYRGPFTEAKGPLWWRGMLDDMVVHGDHADGREFAEAKLGKPVAQSECCEDSSKPAGYYCMLAEKPVSLQNSKGGLPWFPRGADLARISIRKFEEEIPWL